MDIPKIQIPALRDDGTPQRSVVPAGELAGVLIVDDTPAKLAALAAIVSGMALEVVTANSGEQALRQLLKRDFAVILLDVNMPMMNGFETAKLIRSRPRSEHTPIIFVTAEANSEAERFRGYTLGAVDVIYSPIVPEILRAKVRVFVDLFYLQRQVMFHNEHLESLVAQRTAALIKSHQLVEERTRDLAATNAHLILEMTERRNLEINLVRVSEEQRRVIGCELHDGLGQQLVSLALLCASLQQQLANRAQPEANAAQRIVGLINEAAAMTRSVARGLYPAALEYGGLTAALEHLTNNACSLDKMDYVLSVDPEVQVHDPLVAINLYRIAQEAITNALKHSQAGLMRIDLAQVDGKIRLTLSDDGIGIDPSRLGSPKGLGMHSMQYRASLLGGSIKIESNAQQGTSISVTYPNLEGQSEQRNRA